MNQEEGKRCCEATKKSMHFVFGQLGPSPHLHRQKKLLTATCPWACTRKPSTPRGPPLLGARQRPAPRREAPLEGESGRRGEHLSATTDDGDYGDETAEELRSLQQLLSSFRFAETTTRAARSFRGSSRLSMRASSSRLASFEFTRLIASFFSSFFFFSRGVKNFAHFFRFSFFFFRASILSLFRTCSVSLSLSLRPLAPARSLSHKALHRCSLSNKAASSSKAERAASSFFK